MSALTMTETSDHLFGLGFRCAQANGRLTKVRPAQIINLVVQGEGQHKQLFHLLNANVHLTAPVVAMMRKGFSDRDLVTAEVTGGWEAGLA